MTTDRPEIIPNSVPLTAWRYIDRGSVLVHGPVVAWQMGDYHLEPVILTQYGPRAFPNHEQLVLPTGQTPSVAEHFDRLWSVIARSVPVCDECETWRIARATLVAVDPMFDMFGDLTRPVVHR